MSKSVAAVTALGGLSILLLASNAHAQSDPANFDEVINYPTVVLGNTVAGPLPGATVPILDATTQFNFNAGSSSSFNTFSGIDNEVNLFTGSVVSSPTIENGTTLNLVGGLLPNGLTVNGFSVFRPTIANLQSGGLNGVVSITGTAAANIQAGFGIQLLLSGQPTVDILPGANIASIDAPDASTVSISGGSIGSITTSNSARFQINGGLFSGTVDVAEDSRFNISGGDFAALDVSILNDLNIAAGAIEAVEIFGSRTQVHISGGAFGDSPFLVRSRATANITGGQFGDDFQVESDGVANVSGGSFSADVDVEDGGTLNLIATQFLLDGVDRTAEIAQANAEGQDFSINPLNPPMLLEGVFTDDNPFAFAFLPEDPVLAEEVSTLDPNSTVNLIVGAPQLAGDFNGDGLVNLADYTVWRDNLGAGNEASIAYGGDGLNGVDSADYEVWKNNFSGSIDPLSGSMNQIPEPASIIIGLLLGCVLLHSRERSLISLC